MTALRAAPLVCAIAIGLAGCTWNAKDKPLDAGADLPAVKDVISAVQLAIDKTVNEPGWTGDGAFKKANEQCGKDKKQAATQCPALREAAVEGCRREQGGSAGALCAEHFRSAEAACERATNTVHCQYIAAARPPEIQSATLSFVAARSKEMTGSAALKLISTEVARKLGRGTSYEIVLFPMPDAPDSERFQFYQERQDFQGLTDAITTAVRAAYPECSGETCSGVALLGLKSAKYTYEITYTAKTGGGFDWSISPLKLAGKFSASKEAATANTITLELSR